MDSDLGRYVEIESCLVFLIAYTSYFFSNAVKMSGMCWFHCPGFLSAC